MSGIPVVTPVVTLADLQSEYGNQLGSDGLKQSLPPPALRTNAEYAENNPTANQDPNSPYYGSKYFDPKGAASNRAFKVALLALFKEYKPTDQYGRQFLLTWRHYPNAAHPRWQTAEEACGCGCGCTCG